MPVPESCFLPVINDARRTVGRRVFDFDHQIVVMGIVNRTPDSFFDGGRTYGLDGAVSAALVAAEAGAGWVDIGGVPFSPDTPEVSIDEEIERVVPVVEAVAAVSDVVVSVDTWRAAVAEAGLAAGAAVINDTSGLRDPELAAVVAESGATLVITHSAAPPGQHLRRPRYDDVVAQVRAFLASRVERAMGRGVPEERIVIDPGHDLNKNTRHSLEITRRLSEIADLGLPLLAAVSNKDFIQETLDLTKDKLLAGTTATHTYCVLQGARILRVHDVAAAVSAARMTESILGWRPPARTGHNL